MELWDNCRVRLLLHLVARPLMVESGEESPQLEKHPKKGIFMKRYGIVICSLGLLVNSVSGQDKQADAEKPSAKKTQESKIESDFKTVADKVSYGYGYRQGQQMLAGGVKLNPQMIAKGFVDAFADKKSALTRE